MNALINNFPNFEKFRFDKKRSVFLLLLVCVAAWAASYLGPFHVADAGTDYATTTFSQDQSSGIEWAAANRLAGIYVLTMGPAQVAKIIAKKTPIRIVYYDGQIADFTLADNTTAGMRFKKLMATITSKDSDPPVFDSTYCGQVTVGASYAVDTGYWGSYFPDGEETTVGYWVDTGYTYYTVPASFAQVACR